MSDPQAAEIPADELERIRNYLGVWPVTVGMETPGGVPLAKQLLAHADALSARLAEAPRVLHDGEVCGCFDETGKRTVRLYERCERCGAFNG